MWEPKLIATLFNAVIEVDASITITVTASTVAMMVDSTGEAVI